MTFIGCNIMGSKGAGSAIYQPIQPIFDPRCNYTTWSDDSTTDFEGEPLEPVTDGLSMISSGINYGDLFNPINYGANDWTWDFEFSISPLLSGNGYLMRATGDGVSSLIEIRVTSNTLFFFMRDNNGDTLYNNSIGSLLNDTKYKAIISKTGNDLDFQVVGVQVRTTVTADFSAGSTYTQWYYGMRSNNLFFFIGVMYNWNDTLLDNFDFTTRTGIQDINYNIIIGSVNGVRAGVTFFNNVSAYLPLLPVADSFTGVTDLNTISGDSITSGTGVDISWWGYQNNVYSKITNSEIKTGGIPTPTLTSYDYAPTGFYTGAPSQPNGYAPNLTKNTTQQINTLNCTVGTWFLSQNDNENGFVVQESIDVLIAVIAEFKAANVPIIIFTSMPRRASEPTNIAWSDEYTSLALALAASEGVPIVDVNDILSNGTGIILPEYDFDGLHPTELGQQVIGGEYVRVTNQEFKVFPYLVSDTPCAGNNLLIIDGIAQKIDGEWQYLE